MIYIARKGALALEAVLVVRWGFIVRVVDREGDSAAVGTRAGDEVVPAGAETAIICTIRIRLSQMRFPSE